MKLEVLIDPGAQVSAGIWESIVRSVAVRYSAVVVVVRTTMEAVQRAKSPRARAAGRRGGGRRLRDRARARATTRSTR